MKEKKMQARRLHLFFLEVIIAAFSPQNEKF